MNNKALIIGFDGGAWSVLQPALDPGHMPNFNEYLSKGTAGILHSTIPIWGKMVFLEFTYWDRKKKKHVTKRNTLTIIM